MSRLGKLPHSLVLIFGLIVLAQVATYVLPAGEFERQGQQIVDGSYHPITADPLSPFAFLTLIPSGLAEAQDIIFFVFLVGGVIRVIHTTGAIDAVVGTAITNLGRNPGWLIAGMVTLFGIASSTLGMAEEYVPFVPILVTMCLALKLDAIVAVGILYVGAGVGYACAAINPFTVLIAQDIAGLPLTSGQSVRWALLFLCGGIGVHHILRYAKRITLNPQDSLVYDIDYSNGFTTPQDVALTTNRCLVVALMLGALGVFVWGATTRNWYVGELSAVFVGLGLLAAVITRLSPNATAQAFLRGAADMSTTALLIGFARTIQVILTEGHVIDTIVYALAAPLATLPTHAAALSMLAVQTVCNLFIPSGSGQAYVTMPIMAPLADLTGVTRQTAVLAYQFGDGFTNMLVPTNAVLMGVLSLGRIPYQRWAKFVIPLLGKLYLVAAIALILAVQLQYR